METISLKITKDLINEIDKTMKKHRYSTRTEFIRDSIRTKLTELEKQEAIKKLSALRGTLKPKSNLSDEEAGELAFKKIAKKFNLQ